MVKICIVHYNTPKLTECLIRSINKYTPNSCIYIFDNSDKEPFTYRQDNIIYFDNTEEQIINFDEWLEKYPNRYLSSRGIKSKFGSAKHCLTIQKCFELIDDSFILMDSDTLLKKDISPLYDETKIFVGEINTTDNKAYKRLLPFCCFINVNECKKLGIKYFNENYIMGLNTSEESDKSDTGYNFYREAKSYPHTIIRYNDYVDHLMSASWANRNHQLWLDIHKKQWQMDEKIIVTMTTWKDRICNVPVVLNTILSQNKMPNKIVINLSKEEFVSYDNLPQDFKNYVEKHKLIEINWIEGKNIKQWKKIIPTLFKYPKDCVICIDDDRKYPKNFIEALWNTHLKHPDSPITHNKVYRLKGKYLQHAGHGTLDKLEYYNGFKDIDLNDLYRLSSSDSFFTLIANNSGHPILPYEGVMGAISMYNEVSPLKKSQNTYSTASHVEMYNYLLNNKIIDIKNLEKKSSPVNAEKTISATTEVKPESQSIPSIIDSIKVSRTVPQKAQIVKKPIKKNNIRTNSLRILMS